MYLYTISGVRDYIHVVDLAIGHVAAIKKLQEKCRHQVPINAIIVWPLHIALLYIMRNVNRTVILVYEGGNLRYM